MLSGTTCGAVDFALVGAAVISLGVSVGFEDHPRCHREVPCEPGAGVFASPCWSSLAGTIIQIWLVTGVFRGIIRIARRKRVPFEVIFSGGRYLVTVILAGMVGLSDFPGGVYPLCRNGRLLFMVA